MVLCPSVSVSCALYSLRGISHRIEVSRVLDGLGWNQVLCIPGLLLPLVMSSALSSARCSMHSSMWIGGGWVLCMSSMGFVTVLIFSVAFWIWACFSAAPLPDTFTGVAPKVILGVTLGPHDICRLGVVTWTFGPGYFRWGWR